MYLWPWGYRYTPSEGGMLVYIAIDGGVVALLVLLVIYLNKINKKANGKHGAAENTGISNRSAR